MLRISASGTSPSRTARNCSGPLKPSEPPACTVILISPPVALPTSSANFFAFVVWKFPSGHTVARSRLVAADTVLNAPLASTAPAPTMNSRRVNIESLPSFVATSLRRFSRLVAIQIPCRSFRDQFVGQIARDALGRALVRRTDPAATRREHDQPVVRRDFLESLAAHLLARFETDVTGRAIAPAIASARRMIDAVERRQNVPRPPDPAADLDDLTVPALRAPGAAAARAQLLLPEDQRRLAFGDLDRRTTHAARVGSCRQSVFVGPRAGAAV